MGYSFQRYENYKKVDNLAFDELPVEWTLKKVKHLFTIGRGRVISQEELDDNGVFPVYSSQTQNNGCLGFINTYDFDCKQITWTTDGANAGTVFLREGKHNCTNVCGTLQPISKNLNFSFYLYSLQYVTQFHKRPDTNGAKIMNGEMAAISLCIPSDYEQQKIANFLDHESAKIDTLIAKQKKLIELLKEKRQAVISHAVTKGLNPDAPMKDSGVEWLGEVPEHWAVMRLKHLIKSLESGCSVNAADIPANKNELGVLKTSCVYTRRFRASENKTVVKEDLSRVKCPVRKGAIIISRMNTPELVGASALVDTEANNLFLPDRLWQTIFNEQLEVNPEFLAYFMTVEGFRNQISLSAEGASSSMQNIAKEDYLAINALLPQLKEQAEIVSYIKENEAKFLRLEVQAMNAIELMKERKTALISAAVTGKIDVRHFVAEQEQPQGVQG